MTNNKYVFSVIIPVFNESLNVEKLCIEIFRYLKNYSFEVIFIDDCSTDNTFDILSALKNKYIINILQNKKNLGQSFSLSEGIKLAKYNNIVTLDGDGQNNPRDIPKLLDKYFSDEDTFLVGGIRFKRKDTLIKILSSKIANYFRQKILNDNCNDTGCSLKVFDKDIFILFPFFNGIHRFLPALFKGYGKNTFFVNVDHRPRIYGLSKYGTFRRLVYGVRDIFKVLRIIKKYKKQLQI